MHTFFYKLQHFLYCFTSEWLHCSIWNFGQCSQEAIFWQCWSALWWQYSVNDARVSTEFLWGVFVGLWAELSVPICCFFVVANFLTFVRQLTKCWVSIVIWQSGLFHDRFRLISIYQSFESLMEGHLATSDPEKYSSLHWAWPYRWTGECTGLIACS